MHPSTFIRGLLVLSALLFLPGQFCLNAPGSDDDGSGALSGPPSVELSPAEQDISDQGFALLAALARNVPEAGSDADGNHSATSLRWSVVSGGGELNRVGTESDAPLDHATQIDTDPAADFGQVIQYFPASGATGEATIKVEMIRPTDRIVTNPFGETSLEHEDVVVGSATAVVHINDELGLRLTPAFTRLPAGGTVQLRAAFEYAVQNTIAINSPETAEDLGLPVPVGTPTYEWNMTGLAGAGTLTGNTPDSDTVTFTAGTERATFVISVRTTEPLADGTTRVNGPVRAVVDVDPHLRTILTYGWFLCEIRSSWDIGADVVGYLYFPKLADAVSYSIFADHITDSTGAYGDTASWHYSVEPSTGSLVPSSGLEDAGGAYRIGLSAGSGPYSRLNGTYDWLQSRFGSMRIRVTAVVE